MSAEPATRRDPPIVERVIRNDAKACARCSMPATAQMPCAGAEALIGGAMGASRPALELLLESGVPLGMGRDRSLVRAVDASRDDVVDLLLRAGADPELVDEHGGRCLIAAAQRGHVEIVARLLRAGVDVDALTPEGWNAAGVAEDAGHGAVVARVPPSKPRKG